MLHNRWLVALAALLGIVLIALSIVYFAVPARSLPSILPGHQAGSSHIHVKHGVAALLLGLACFAFVWFATGPKHKPSAP